MSELLLLLILAFIFIFTPDTYIGSKYRLSVYLICNNRFRYRPWKTHIGRPLVRTTSPRHPSGKDPWNQWTTYTLTLLQLEQTTDSSGRRGTGPPTEPGFSQGFFSILSPMEFSFLAAVASGLLSWGHFISSTIIDWLHRYYLNWTELDNAITKFNNEMHSANNWVLNPVILHYWHNLPILILCSALLQFVLLKALYK